MDLYCPDCGHLIRVVGHWDGREFTLSLRDGLLTKGGPAITACPQCRGELTPDVLAFLLPAARPPVWAPAPEAATNLDGSPAA